MQPTAATAVGVLHQRAPPLSEAALRCPPNARARGAAPCGSVRPLRRCKCKPPRRDELRAPFPPPPKAPQSPRKGP
eukprot:scaffold336_cov384-Prasinococcus_capsulatus_cf.AAC.25